MHPVMKWIILLILVVSYGLCVAEKSESLPGFGEIDAVFNVTDELPAVTNVSNTTHRKYAYLYTNLRVYFLKWYLPVVVGVGTFGTVFCLIFLFLSRLFPANMLLWLVSICVGDFLILVMEGIWMLLKVWLNYDIRDINNVACVIHTSFSNYLYYWSAYMQCFLSMQRAYLIIRPLRARGSGPNMRCLLFIWVSISVLLMIPMLPYSLYWRVIDGDCDPPRESLFRITTLSDFIIWSLIPLIGMTSATAIICWNIFRIRRSFLAGNLPVFSQNNNNNNSGPSNFTYVLPPARASLPNRLGCLDHDRFVRSQQLTNPQNRILTMLSQHNLRAANSGSRSVLGRLDKSAASGENAVAFVRTAPSVPNSQGQRHGATDNAGHVTRLLICMNIWYMISTYPLMIYLMFLNFIIKDMDRDVHKFMYYLSRSLCFLNACSNWIFYCASGRLFRQRIKQICRRFLRRFRFYSGSHSSGFNDYPGNGLRYTSQGLRDRCTITPVNDMWGRRQACPIKKVLSADNLQLQANYSFPQFLRPQSQSPLSNRGTFMKFFHNLFTNCHAFRCHCFCTKPLPCVVHNTPSDSQPGEDETRDSVSHGTVFCPRTTVASEHVFECEACCTGFCCWKFWWYGFSGGLMKKDSLFNTTITRDRSKGHSYGLTSSSSSLYFHSELARHHSQLRGRSACSQHQPNLYHFQHHPQCSDYQSNQNNRGRPTNRYHHSQNQLQQYRRHQHQNQQSRSHTQSDEQEQELEPMSSCVRDSRVSWGLPENLLQNDEHMIRSKRDLYGSAPSALVDPGSQGRGTSAVAFPTTHLTAHGPPPRNQLRPSANSNPQSATNSNNNNNNNPMCYCYISSLGKRRYHYHLCKLHQNDPTRRDEHLGCRHYAVQHPFALTPLHGAQSEGRILRALDANRDDCVSLPPVRQQSTNVITQSSSH